MLDGIARRIFALRDATGAVAGVYARINGNELETALAVRNPEGVWQLGDWQRHRGEPSLIWTAQSTSSGWLLQTVGWGSIARPAQTGWGAIGAPQGPLRLNARND